MEKLNFYSHERISERVWIFTEGYSAIHRFTIGVIVGDEKVLVIDSGLGMGGDLREAIEAVIGKDKPIICACTHCHVDHVGSAIQFDEAYCNLSDYEHFYDFAFGEQQRLDDLNAFAMESLEVAEYGKYHYVKNRETVFQDLQDGDVLELGNVQIQVYALPAHSGGSMVFYYKEEKILFTGDDINTDVSIKKLTCEELADYAVRLRALEAKVGEDVTIYPGHLHMPMDIKVLRGIAKACEEIANGETLSDPPGETIFSNRANNANIRMHMADNSIVIYSKKFTKTETDSRHLNFYSHERRGKRLYIVTENYSQVHRLTIGVIVGDEKVLVIDAGLGMTEELRAYIEKLVGTEKPLLCACTSGAWDHVGSACSFDRVYLNPKDTPLLDRACDWELRRCRFEAYNLHNHEIQKYGYDHGIKDNAFMPEPIEEGMAIDLGNVSVEAMALPGVTDGQTAYWFPEEKVCFCGDAANMDIHLEHMDGESLIRYAERLEQLAGRLPKDTVYYSAHTNRPHRKRMLESLVLACREVAAGQINGDPPQESMYACEYGNEAIRLHYSGSTCVIYDRRKV